MSGFKVWLRTHAPDCVPKRRRLFIEEPRRRCCGGWSRPARTLALWYTVHIVKLAPTVVDEDEDPELPPPRQSSPPPFSDDGCPMRALVWSAILLASVREQGRHLRLGRFLTPCRRCWRGNRAFKLKWLVVMTSAARISLAPAKVP